MTRPEIFTKAKEYIRNGQVKILSVLPNTITAEVGEYIVTRRKLRGYSVDTCQCEHHSRHPDGRCAHKDAFVTMLVMKGI